jgi:hypothetical protein
MDRPYHAALSAASDGDIVAAILRLGDDRLLAVSRQLSRHAAAAQSRRSAQARKASLSEEAFEIIDAAADGMPRGELIRRLRCSAADLDEAVRVLVYMKRISALLSGGSTGRRAMLYITPRNFAASSPSLRPAAS